MPLNGLNVTSELDGVTVKTGTSANPVLESFQTIKSVAVISGNVNVPDGSLDWTPSTGTHASDWTTTELSTSHVTQGTFSYHLVVGTAPTGNAQFSTQVAANLSAYSKVRLDVYISSIDVSGNVLLMVGDSSFSQSYYIGTTVGGTGSFTIEIDLATAMSSGLTTKASTFFTIFLNGDPGGSNGDLYFDNLRGVV